MRASRLDTALWLLSVLDRETDDYGTIAKLVTLYRFAIANYANPLAELLLNAIAAMEAGGAVGDESVEDAAR